MPYRKKDEPLFIVAVAGVRVMLDIADELLYKPADAATQAGLVALFSPTKKPLTGLFVEPA
jgi:hypothetical protein